ncbi:PREDICTED: uncharacterized protein LOC18604251 isoform X2 [Theobroma cacao]|uniref:Uncharacterized protein LOC18604251 isoform X2 n=1 Tax=Theobroma cacao TaxID=3641 RepID=A0AB32W1Y3_THECC|nr:PREDICTED: uncharacterized protein LOC18604251 isoform X2 [Theobroma cacao]XP_017972801.1 PREDICTED: uncharacterized protein LOC18604251 isoform X2 [Theobroma cacao]XP_017972802.1 PREDICTED: uncharacterized protein LOC18604251 isoform X2 [Theobroma cacao]
MGFQAAPSSSFLSPLVCHTYPNLSPSQLSSLRPFLLPHKHVNSFKPHIPCLNSAKFLKARTRATLDEKEKEPLLVQEQEASRDVEESVKVLKNAAKTRKIPAEEVLSAFSVIEKAKLNPSAFLETLGGPDSPGRTCVLIFTAEKQLKDGRYFPLTAVQRFDAVAKRIENGVFLGPIGFLTFEGKFSWKNRILSFIFEKIRVKIGPFNPLEISLGQKEDREPSTKDPFFIWFYIDEEIAVARGRSGGTAFWCRCHRVTT